MRRAVILACTIACALPAQAAAARDAKTSFNTKRAGEALLTLRASAPGTDWGREGSESAVVRVQLDGRYNQDVVLFEGARAFDYAVSLGPVSRGHHTVTASFDREKSPAGATGADVGGAAAVARRGLARAALRADRLRPRPARDRRRVREQPHRRAAAHLPRAAQRRLRQHRARVHGDLVQRGRRHQHAGADGALGAHDRHRVDLPRHALARRPGAVGGLPGAQPRDARLRRRQARRPPDARDRHLEQQHARGEGPAGLDRLPLLPRHRARRFPRGARARR